MDNSLKIESTFWKTKWKSMVYTPWPCFLRWCWWNASKAYLVRKYTSVCQHWTADGPWDSWPGEESSYLYSKADAVQMLTACAWPWWGNCIEPFPRLSVNCGKRSGKDTRSADGEECWKMLSSGQVIAIAHISLQKLWLPAQDLHARKPAWRERR